MEKNNFIYKNENGTALYLSPNIKKLNFVNHFFSTRIGGVSNIPYDSLNLGIYTEDFKKNIDDNYKIIFGASNFKSKRIFHLNQVHGNDFYLVDDENFNRLNGAKGDAVITSSPNIAIGVLTADCVPILVVDIKNKIIAAIHAGWKGTYLHITQNVLQYMIKYMNSDKDNIVAAIGPSIGPCCFEVGKEVAYKFNSVIVKHNSYYVNLWDENLSQFIKCGIKRENIVASNLCTKCRNDQFFSYRGENGTTGRLGAFIEITRG